MRQPARPRWIASLLLALACIASHAAPAATRKSPTPRLHYTIVTHRFDVVDSGRPPDERSMARQVEWSYPVFTVTRDPATAALNAWVRLQSLQLLLGDAPDVAQLSDEQAVAKAVADQDFIDGGADQASIVPASALGRLRGFRYYGESIGGNHPIHGLTSHLFNLDARKEVSVESLFKADDDGILPALYDAQVQPPNPVCTGREFGWADVTLRSADTLVFDYPYEPGHKHGDVDCDFIVIESPQVTRLLKSPRRLRPDYALEDDTPRPLVHHRAKKSAASEPAATP